MTRHTLRFVKNAQKGLGNPFQSRISAVTPISVSVIIVIGTILLLAGFFYWLFFTPAFAIEKINIKTNQIFSNETIAEIIKNKLGDWRWGFIKQDNIFAFDSKALQDELRNQLNVERVYLKKERPHNLSIIISGKPWLAIWSVRGNYYSLDEQGIVLGQLNKLPTDAKLETSFYSKPIIYSQDSVLPNTRDKVLNSAILSLISQLLQNEYIKTLRPQFFIIERSDSDNLAIKVREGWKIHFDARGDIIQQIRNLGLILRNSIPPDRQKQLDYIDLRFRQQVYYKFR